MVLRDVSLEPEILQNHENGGTSCPGQLFLRFLVGKWWEKLSWTTLPTNYMVLRDVSLEPKISQNHENDGKNCPGQSFSPFSWY